jgi:hypothetical protein
VVVTIFCSNTNVAELIEVEGPPESTLFSHNSIVNPVCYIRFFPPSLMSITMVLILSFDAKSRSGYVSLSRVCGCDTNSEGGSQ